MKYLFLINLTALGFFFPLLGNYKDSFPSLNNDFLFAIHIGPGIKIPLGESYLIWHPYPSGLLAIDLPSSAAGFTTRFELQTGIIRSQQQRLRIVHQSFLLLFDKLRLNKHFNIAAMTGLCNTMIFNSEKIEFDTDPFSPSENEFGITAGVELAYRIGLFKAAIPAAITTIFSSPKRFTFLSLSATVGRLF